VVATPADAVRDADVVITSLTGPDAVRAAYRGPVGALAAAHGQVFVDMSTSGPDLLAELDPQLAATGSTLLDAPIIGAPTVVLRGEAAILVAARRRTSSVSSRYWSCSGRCAMSAPWAAGRASSWWPTACSGR